MNPQDFTVLNTDDDDAGRYAKGRILRRAGYQVVDAATGAETLRLVRETKPQLVLLDVMLPDIDGLEVCQILKADPETARIMVLQISATHVSDMDRTLGLERGADGYLTEPVEAEELLATVKSLLRLYIREEENRQLLKQLRDADQQKDEFLATLAHELRNPLHPIRAALEMMRMRQDLDSEIQLCRDAIDQQVNHLARLIDDLLDVARITSDTLVLRKERLDLASVLHSAVKASRDFMESRGHRPIVTLPEAIEVDGDSVRLTQILVNLLNNAAKYTPAGRNIRLSVRIDSGAAVISVKDEGIGISADQLPRVFDKFYQIDRRFERTEAGLGLGLSLVRKLTELHGGSVQARSEGLGKGSEFILSLPVLAPSENAQAPAPPPASAAEPSRAHCRFLIVDDGPHNREMFSMLLRRAGHEVESAADGMSAIEIVQSFRPDVVLLDVGMPGLNGFDTCKEIRANPWGKTLTMIAVTGWSQQEVQERADRAGFDAILVKPVTIQEILRTAEDVSKIKARQ